MSFSKIGAIVFNQPAARVLQESKIKDVLLPWDSESHQLALQKAPEADDDRAYTIRYNDKANGASFSAKPFLDHFGIQYQRSSRTQMSVEIKPDQDIFLEVKVPASLFEADNLFSAEGAENTSSPSSSDG